MTEWTINSGDGPIIAAAIHSGHGLRPEVATLMQLSAAKRLREEDPFTDLWTDICSTSVVAHTSRFEVDLNRPFPACVYLKPDDAWGLEIWKRQPPEDIVNHSRSRHFDFYSDIFHLLSRKVRRHDKVVVLDIHSYNHRRNGPNGQPDNANSAPDINVGTGSLNKTVFGNLTDRVMDDLRTANYLGATLDVRENVKFKGGYFPTCIHQQFPETVCVLALEVKKIFMDEWSGKPDNEKHRAIKQVLASIIPGIEDELGKLPKHTYRG